MDASQKKFGAKKTLERSLQLLTKISQSPFAIGICKYLLLSCKKYIKPEETTEETNC